MAIFSNFKSDTLWKAFILNSLTATITIYIAIILKEYLDKVNKDKNNDWFNSIIILIITFCTSMITYLIMFFLFGFGISLIST
jgi:uncharacterized membrane protein